MIDVEFDADAVQDALSGQADTLRSALEARIQQKLSGEVLQIAPELLPRLLSLLWRTMEKTRPCRSPAWGCHMRPSRNSAGRRQPMISSR